MIYGVFIKFICFYVTVFYSGTTLTVDSTSASSRTRKQSSSGTRRHLILSRSLASYSKKNFIIFYAICDVHQVHVLFCYRVLFSNDSRRTRPSRSKQLLPPKTSSNRQQKLFGLNSLTTTLIWN